MSNTILEACRRVYESGNVVGLILFASILVGAILGRASGLTIRDVAIFAGGIWFSATIYLRFVAANRDQCPHGVTAFFAALAASIPASALFTGSDLGYFVRLSGYSALGSLGIVALMIMIFGLSSENKKRKRKQKRNGT